MERTSESGLPIEPVYDPSKLTDFRPEEKLGRPGEYPFTRGVYPRMYVDRPWTMRQYAGFATAQESNRRYHELIEAGTTGLSVAFDLPTQMGYDSDAPVAHGEVGKVGVAIDCVEDMRTLFGGIPLDTVSTSMTINAPAAVLLLMYQTVGEEQGARPQTGPRRPATRGPGSRPGVTGAPEVTWALWNERRSPDCPSIPSTTRASLRTSGLRKSSESRESIRSLAECIRGCTSTGRGRCASTPALPRPRSPTAAITS